MADSWIPHQEGLLGDRHNTGILRVATGYGIDTAGRKVSGAMLAIDWLVVDDVYSCVLLKCDDGRTTFMRAKNMLVAERSPQMAFKRLEGPAYTSCDPILDTQAISTGFVRNCAGNLADLADQVRPHVEKFLAAYYDPEVLKTNVGRPITAREYVFLAPNEYRRQAIEAMPWLLTYFVSEYGTPVVTEIVRVIDGAEELTSALCKCFGVTPSVIRSMAVFSAPAPNSFRLGERQAADAHTILMALSQIPPEQRPSKDRTERFLKVIIWAETLIANSRPSWTRIPEQPGQ